MSVSIAINRIRALVAVAFVAGAAFLQIGVPVSAESVIATIQVPPPNTQVFKVAVNSLTNRVYVTQFLTGSLLVINGNTNTILTTISMPTGPNGETPRVYHVAVDEQTNRVYVVADFNLVVVNGATNAIVGTTPLNVNGSPQPVAVNPQTKRVYVGLWYFGTVLIFDASSDNLQPIAEIPNIGTPVSMAVHLATNRLYVVNNYGNTVTVIDGVSHATTIIPVGAFPHEVRINQQIGMAYVTNTNNASFVPYSPNTNSVSVISLGSNAVVATVPVGNHPSGVAVNPALNRVYAVNSVSSTVSVIDAAINTVLQTIPVGSSPAGAAANPATGLVYVANGNANSISVIGKANAAPVLGPITTSPAGPVAVGATLTASASFTDANSQDSHTALWTWDDGATTAGTITFANGAGTVTGSHVYTVPGVYTLGLSLTDQAGSTATARYEYVVVYDPSGGSVTGGGWITSPAGAYRPDPTLSGRASFGFVSRYQPGATVPTGQTEFQFHAGNLTFHSGSYEWLVVAGARAQFKGTGTVNGMAGYSFLLTAIDGQLSGGGGVDRFRIKIWSTSQGETAGLVYDNNQGSANDADPATALGGGNILIHNK
jgi:YVTN family beta-propeller protein